MIMDPQVNNSKYKKPKPVIEIKTVLSLYLRSLFVGIAQFYSEMLSDIVQYPDLRTDVFQSFREIGNAILLTLLMEQSLVTIWMKLTCTNGL